MRSFETAEDHRAHLDPVKRMVAVVAQHAYLTGPDRPALTGIPKGCAVTAEAVTATVTEVRVKTPGQGERCFLVTVKETGA